MTYDAHDAAIDAMYEKIGDELYPEHKAQAISEFTAERLRSFYVDHPRVMRPAVDAIQEGNRLYEAKFYAAAMVFFVSAIEILLKATLLKPVVYGLVHSESIASVIVELSLSGTGYVRYSKLLEKLFFELAEMDIKTIKRTEGKADLLEECSSQQKLRNDIVHQGASCSPEQAALAHDVAVAVFDEIVNKMLYKLGLTVIEEGVIQPISS